MPRTPGSPNGVWIDRLEVCRLWPDREHIVFEAATPERARDIARSIRSGRVKLDRLYEARAAGTKVYGRVKATHSPGGKE